MLQKLVYLSLQHRRVTVALACLLLAYGIQVTTQSKLDVFPDFVPPQVTVQTEAPGLAPEQVELLVTRPVEQALAGLGDQESLRSESIQGLSIVTIVFQEKTDIFRARQMLSEKLGEMGSQLPVGVKPPKMSPLTSATMDLLKIGLVSEKMTPMELRTFADWTLKPRLLAVPGVAKCSSFGGEIRQIQIRPDPERLLAHGLSLTDVLNAARMATGVRGAGFVETPSQRIVIQTEGQTFSPQLLGEIKLSTSTNGIPIRLKDVAQVVDGSEPKYGDCLIQGRQGVLLTMSSQYGANTLEVTRALEQAIKEMDSLFKQEGIFIYPRLHRPATFIEAALGNIRHSLWLGSILVAVVLFLFLGHARIALISLTAIPLSLLTAIIIMEKLGISLNTVTLGGLAIAIGEVVDDAIIDVENISRRLKENQLLAAPRPAFAVVLEASMEVRGAVVFATFIVALVFVPVLTLTGLQGSFFAPLALSYLLAIFASLAVALTLTPALALVLFSRGVDETREPKLQAVLKRAYHGLLDSVMRWPKTLVVLALFLAIGAALRVPSLGGEFLPEFREGHYVLQISTVPGTSLPEMQRLGTQISAALLKDPRVATVEQQIGRAELGEDPWGPHRSEFHVELKPLSGEEEGKMTEAIRNILAGFPGIQYEVMTFLGDRIGETISGETAPVVVNIYGEDLDLLDAKARQVATVLQGIPGAADVQIKSPPGTPRLAVRLRPERLVAWGFQPVEVLDTVQTAYQGTVVAQCYQGSQVTDVAVVMAGGGNSEPENVGKLLLRSSQGAMVPLSELADVYLTSGRHSILHDAGRRRQTVTCQPSGVDLTAFTTAARQKINSDVVFPKGTYMTLGGAAEAAGEAQQQILTHSLIALVGIVVLLGIALRNTPNVLLVLANAPFALVGGVLAVWLTEHYGNAGGLNLGSLVGFVTLFGITMRNSIMLISHYEHLVLVEGAEWNLATAIRGATERLIPILMTALVTSLGLLPLALGSGEAGREIEGPMAIVILGGLFTSTILNLLVLPSLALRYARFVDPREGISS